MSDSSTIKQDYKIPEWLNDGYVLKVLESGYDYKPGEIVLIQCHVECATNKGDNYASEMFRISAEYSEKGDVHRKQIILKKDHDDQSVNQYFEEYNLYSTEIRYYSEYQPALEKLLRFGNESTQLSPRMIFHEDPVFIMEDMAPLNYRTVNRMSRFDCTTTAKLVLTKLARLHAASMVHNQRNSGCLEKTQRVLFEVEEGFMSICLKKLDILMRDMLTWEMEYAAIIPKIKKFRENFRKIGERAMMPTEGMGVLIHGDSWVNNFLVRFEKDAPVDVLLIDFQICAWSSPAIDLLYFMFTSLNEADYQDQMKFNEFIKHYHDELVRVLRALNHPRIPSLMQLQLEIQSKLSYAIFGGVMIKSIIYAEKSNTADIAKLMNEKDEESDLTFENPRFRNEMKFLVKWLDLKGALDVSL